MQAWVLYESNQKKDFSVQTKHKLTCASVFIVHWVLSFCRFTDFPPNPDYQAVPNLGGWVAICMENRWKKTRTFLHCQLLASEPLTNTLCRYRVLCYPKAKCVYSWPTLEVSSFVFKGKWLSCTSKGSWTAVWKDLPHRTLHFLNGGTGTQSDNVT